MAQKHILIVYAEDEPGVLNRVASLFRRRGFNIESIAVGRSEQPHLSRMTIVVDGTNTSVEQVTKQLYKLVEVVKAVDITEENTVNRELALIKVRTTPSTRSEIMQIVDIFRANIVDVCPDSVIVEVTGDQDKVNSLCELLVGFGVRELARAGVVAMGRGAIAAISVDEKEVERRQRLVEKEAEHRRRLKGST